MKTRDRRFLVSGGCGFIGSHLVDRLIAAGGNVVVVDECATGRRERVPAGVSVVEANLTEPEIATSVLDASFDAVFHFAARSNANDDDPRGQFRENTTMTQELLRASGAADVGTVVHASSSAIYGEAPRPTPETYAPIEPQSVYGASKLAAEGLLSAHVHAHGCTVWNFRLANVVGPRQRDGVVPEFVEKLMTDPERLEILGNGCQEKSFLHVDDCLDAMFHAIAHADDGTDSNASGDRRSDEGAMYTVNLGTRTTTSVERVADIVSDVMGIDPEYEYTGGDRGWVGDVPRMRLSIEKLSALGWTPELESDRAVRRAAEELLEER